MKTRLSLAAVLAAAAVSAANAEFFEGQLVAVSGFAASSTLGNTSWGAVADQGLHAIGSQSDFWDSVYGTAYPVVTTSVLNDPNSVSFSIDFAGFFPADFEVHTIEILGLKSDGTIAGASGNSQGFSTDGNSVFWQGSGAELASIGTLSFKVFQVPAPGAVALLGLAGLAGSRRRRA